MNIVIVSDFDPKGSGYAHIASNIGIELVRRGHRVTAFGASYNGEEHTFPFGITPLHRSGFVNQVIVAVRNARGDGLADHVIVMFDIPFQCSIGAGLEDVDIPVSGLFPLEAPPLNMKWALGLSALKHRFTISGFAEEECAKAGIKAIHTPIPVDTLSFRPSTPSERKMLREALGFTETQKVVLTVAANQERKNLSALLEIIKGLPEVTLLLVTDSHNPSGWVISDYTQELGIEDRVIVFERGIEFRKLWSLYAIADAFLITSKAEGLGMPVLEAMSCGVPVVAPNHTSFHEHFGEVTSGWLGDTTRGWPFKYTYKYRDVYGNEWRYFADVEDGIRVVNQVFECPDLAKARVERAHKYVESRTWEKVGEIICTELTS